MNRVAGVPICYIRPVTTRLSIPRKFLDFSGKDALAAARRTPRFAIIGTGRSSKRNAEVRAPTSRFFLVCPGCMTSTSLGSSSCASRLTVPASTALRSNSAPAAVRGMIRLRPGKSSNTG